MTPAPSLTCSWARYRPERTSRSCWGSHRHRPVRVGRDCWRSPSPTSPSSGAGWEPLVQVHAVEFWLSPRMSSPRPFPTTLFRLQLEIFTPSVTDRGQGVGTRGHRQDGQRARPQPRRLGRWRETQPLARVPSVTQWLYDLSCGRRRAPSLLSTGSVTLPEGLSWCASPRIFSVAGSGRGVTYLCEHVGCQLCSGHRHGSPGPSVRAGLGDSISITIP